MTASEKLNLAAKIAYQAEMDFPSYTIWFNSEVKAGRLNQSRFALEYKRYEAAKMAAAKRAVAAAFNS